MVDRPRIVEVLVWTGWVTLGAFDAVVLSRFDEALESRPGWSDRLLSTSYAVTPPSALALVVAALCVLAATVVRAGYGSSDHHPGRAVTLARVVILTAAIAGVLGLIGLVASFDEDYGSGIGRVLPFLGGIAVAVIAAVIAQVAAQMVPMAPTGGTGGHPHHGRPISPFSQPPAPPGR